MTQYETIMKQLNAGKRLTSATARTRFGITNLPARVSELRAKGYSINIVKTKDGKSAYEKASAAAKASKTKKSAKK